MLDRADVIFRYDGSLEGLLCCVFESFRSRRLPLDIWEAQEPRLSLVPEFTVPSRREEAARMCGCSYAAARQRLSRARKRLRTELEVYDHG